MNLDSPEPRVSIIIPTRNNLDTLPQTLHSVHEQHMPDIEINRDR